MVKKIIIALIVILIAAGFIYGWQYYQKNRAEAKEFVGQVKKVENNTLSVEGIYVVENRKDLNNARPILVLVLIDANTKIIKERLQLPTIQEVEKTGGRYNPAKLKKESAAGSLSDIRTEDVSVTVKSLKNIYGRSSFTASEIIYIEPVYP